MMGETFDLFLGKTLNTWKLGERLVRFGILNKCFIFGLFE